MSVMVGEQSSAGSDASRLTLRDVLREDAFRLELLTGDEASLGRIVAGAHAAEVHVPIAAVGHGWIVLVSADRLCAEPEAARRLVVDLEEAGAAALGITAGSFFDDVPAELLDEAEHLQLPVFTVPRSTPAHEVIAFVQRNLVSDEVLAFSRMTALQSYLMDALGAGDPRATLVHRLAEFVGVKAGVLEPDGHFAIATSGDLPASDILACLAGRRHMSVRFDVAGVHGHAFALGDPELSTVAWLVVAVANHRRLPVLAKMAGSTAVPLLTAIDRLDEAERVRDDAARQAAFEAILDADTPQAARVSAAQLGVWGIQLQDGVAVVALEDPSGRVSATQLLEQVRTQARRLKRPTLCTARDGHVLVLAPAPVGDADVSAVLAASGCKARAGVGRSVVEPLDVRRSASEASLAVGAGQGGTGVGRYDDLDLGTLVLQELQLDRLAPKIDQWLEPLRGTPKVFDTLIAYFENNLDVGRTAEVLHLHPNSVRYRLARAEEIIGAPVRSTSTMIAFHVAIAAGGAQQRAA